MKVNRHKLDGPTFPSVLKSLANPPKQLFCLGAPIEDWIDKPRVAVVGSRKVTPYGKVVTEQLAGELARAGVVIISGLALGVDSVAHRAALEARGTTIAVLPGSVDKIYPASHLNLAQQIAAQGGTLISEYPTGAQTFKQNFIARNRIVSGLADVLLITEAAINSGALHTAGFALEQGKTVMAVPGNITSPGSQGTNNLIKSGALPATSAEDVLFALNLNPAKSKQQTIFRGTPDEEAVLERIKRGQTSQEEIAEALSLDAPTLGFVLTYLEINGHIRSSGGGHWQAT